MSLRPQLECSIYVCARARLNSTATYGVSQFQAVYILGFFVITFAYYMKNLCVFVCVMSTMYLHIVGVAYKLINLSERKEQEFKGQFSFSD